MAPTPVWPRTCKILIFNDGGRGVNRKGPKYADVIFKQPLMTVSAVMTVMAVMTVTTATKVTTVTVTVTADTTVS